VISHVGIARPPVESRGGLEHLEFEQPSKNSPSQFDFRRNGPEQTEAKLNVVRFDCPSIRFRPPERAMRAEAV
jgi:hypothetical protein